MSKIKFLDINSHNLHNEINYSIRHVVDTCSFINGPSVKIFEENFAKFLNLKYFIGVGNGTDALEIALESLNLDIDSEVIVQGNTYVATCQAVIRNNLKLVLCDCDKNTYQIDTNDFISKITEKTKVLILVHLYGLVCNMDEIVTICKKNNIILIEDCAQAHGAMYKDKRIGTYGLLSCFSFYPGKNLGAYGDGGGIGTNDYNLYNKIIYLRNNGSIIKYQHDYIGRNSRLDSIQAAILDVKLPHLDINNEKRRNLVNIYNQELKDIVKIPIVNENTTPVYHLYVIQSNYRDDLQQFLKDNNIETIIHYPISICKLKAYTNNIFTNNCIELSNKILSLPLYPELDENKVVFICGIIKEFYSTRNTIYRFKQIKTQNKGGVLNCINELNFDTKRIFYITDLNKKDLSRGNHANKSCKEFIFVTAGGIKLELTDKNNNKITVYLYTNEGYIIDRMLWLSFTAICDNSTLMVLCDEEFYGNDAAKSISNFDNFLELGNNNKTLELFISTKYENEKLNKDLQFEEKKNYLFFNEFKEKYGTRYNSIIENNEDINQYSTYAPSCRKLYDLLQYLDISSNDSIIDIGCGRGFALTIFNLFPFKKITGIEISEIDLKICKNNFSILKINNINLFNNDILEFKDFNDYNIFYFYSPFNSIIFEKVISQIPRNSTLIYKNIHSDEIEILKKFNYTLYMEFPGEDRNYMIFK